MGIALAANAGLVVAAVWHRGRGRAALDRAAAHTAARA
jgi:hypothetical protein